MTDLNTRLAMAAELRRKGYNCAQSVIMCFPDVTGLSEADAARLTSALGSGCAAMGEICGVANAMAIVIGSRHGDAPEAKMAAAKEARELLAAFKASNGDRISCRDLKGKPDVRSCNDLVLQGVEMLHKHLEC